MPLTPADYYKRFRLDTGDELKPGDGSEPDADCLWKDSEIFEYLNDAQVALARKTNALRDVHDVALSVGVSQYTLPTYIHRPRYAKSLAAGERRIYLLNGLDDHNYGGEDYGVPRQVFEEAATGPVEALIFDEKTNRIRAAPTPTVAETVRIFVFRLPKNAVKDDTCPLEFADERFKPALLSHMKMSAYNKHDADTQNKQEAQKFELMYEREADKLISELKMKVRRSGTVRMGGGVWG